MDKQKATALEVLEEAKAVRAQASEMLVETKRQSAENLDLLRRCEAMIRHPLVVVKPKVRKGAMAEQAEELAADSEQLAEDIRNRDCHDVILGITHLAMMNQKVIHINAWYSGHVNSLSVAVHPANEKYMPVAK